MVLLKLVQGYTTVKHKSQFLILHIDCGKDQLSVEVQKMTLSGIFPKFQ